VMSINDQLMIKYAEYLTDLDLNTLKTLHPKEAKLTLAKEIVRLFHDEKRAQSAYNNFEKTFSQHQTPDNIIEVKLDPSQKASMPDIMVKEGLAASKNEARRLLKQGAVSLDGVKLTDENMAAQKGVLKVGKKQFRRLI